MGRHISGISILRPSAVWLHAIRQLVARHAVAAVCGGENLWTVCQYPIDRSEQN